MQKVSSSSSVKISGEEVIFSTLKEDQVDEAAFLIYDCFKKKNPLWKELPSTFEEMRLPISRRLQKTLKRGTTFVALKDGKVQSLFACIDLGDFKEHIQEERKQQQPYLLSYLNSLSSEFFQKISSAPHQKQTCFALYGATNSNPENKNLVQYVIDYCNWSLFEKGYKQYFLVITSERMMDIFRQGSEKKAEKLVVSNVHPNMNGRSIYLALWNISSNLQRQKL